MAVIDPATLQPGQIVVMPPFMGPGTGPIRRIEVVTVSPGARETDLMVRDADKKGRPHRWVIAAGMYVEVEDVAPAERCRAEGHDFLHELDGGGQLTSVSCARCGAVWAATPVT